MKILFINFNIGSTPGINNGIAVLSAILKSNRHQVKLIFLCEELGYGLDFVRLKSDIAEYNPDIIGISLMEPQFKYTEAFCNDLGNYYKGFVICGGPYPTMNPEDVLAVKGVDAVCVGEGDDAVLEVAGALQEGASYLNIKNLWFKLDNGKIIKNGLRPFKNLKDLPPEDKELFDLDKLLPLKNYQLETTISRGCPYKCSYCINMPYLNQYRNLCQETINENAYLRVKEIATVIREIKGSISRHPQVKKIAFIDDNFILFNDFLEDFSKVYKKEIGLAFVCNANPISYNASIARLLKDSGCDDIRFGIESGSERIKKDIMKRPVSNQRVISAFRANQGLGLMTSSFNMIGLPTETKEEVFETLKLNALIIPDSIKVMTFYPFSNTPLHDLCVRLNLIDYQKKDKLDDYDTSTCLKFPYEHQLFLRKVQIAFNWYVNIFLNNECSGLYRSLIKDIESMPENEWERFDFYGADKEASQRLRQRGIAHYSKFMNKSLAVKFPSKHLN